MILSEDIEALPLTVPLKLNRPPTATDVGVPALIMDAVIEASLEIDGK